MKKPLILFVVIFSIAAWTLGAHFTKAIELDAAIAQAPAYTSAVAEGIVVKKFKSMSNYHVRYAYQVAGATYRIDSQAFGKDGAARELLSIPSVEVAYAAGAPDKAVLRRDFDARDKQENVVGAMLRGAVWALVAGLIATLLLSWKLGWLSRSTT